MNEFDESTAEVLPFPGLAPVIRYVAGRLPEVVDEAESVLIAADAPVYSRGSVLVTPALASVPASDGRTFLSPRLQLVSDTWMVERLTSVAKFEKYDRRSKRWLPINCPVDVARTLLCRTSWRFPSLAGIVPAPLLSADGLPIEVEGYDQRSLLILDFQGASFERLQETPGRRDAQMALEAILEVFSTFPAVDATDRSVIVSALLTALVRRSLPTAPLHAVTAHSAGSGKSLLVDVIATIVTGRPCPVTAAGRTAEELEKRLGAMMLQGDPLISIDNVDQPLSSDFLCQVLTQEVVKIRVLGKSLLVEVPTGASFFATGNNLRLAGDLSRRCLMIRLDPACENPELRSFERDAIRYAQSVRGKLVRAGLTLMRAHALAGRPSSRPALGSYNDWSAMVRDAIMWSGGADPVASLEHGRANDPERETLRAAIWAWHSVFKDLVVTVADVTAKAERHAALRIALLAVAGDHGDINAQRLGKWLAKVADRRLDGAWFARQGGRQGVALWRLVGFVGVEGSSEPSMQECH